MTDDTETIPASVVIDAGIDAAVRDAASRMDLRETPAPVDEDDDLKEGDPSMSFLNSPSTERDLYRVWNRNNDPYRDPTPPKLAADSSIDDKIKQSAEWANVPLKQRQQIAKAADDIKMWRGVGESMGLKCESATDLLLLKERLGGDQQQQQAAAPVDKAWAPVREVFSDPHIMETCQRNGLHPAEAARRLFNVEASLSHDPVRAVIAIAQAYGVSREHVDAFFQQQQQQQYQQPQQYQQHPQQHGDHLVRAQLEATIEGWSATKPPISDELMAEMTKVVAKLPNDLTDVQMLDRAHTIAKQRLAKRANRKPADKVGDTLDGFAKHIGAHR